MEHADDFAAFYAASYARLVGQLYAVTGDLAEAEDVVQEAFARAVVRWPRIRSFFVTFIPPDTWVAAVTLYDANGQRICSQLGDDFKTPYLPGAMRCT